MVDRDLDTGVVVISSGRGRPPRPPFPIGNPPPAPCPPVQGTVVQIDRKLRAIVLSFGRDQGVAEGHRVTVQRLGRVVGTALVTQLFRDLCGAKIEGDIRGVQLGDRATTVGASVRSADEGEDSDPEYGSAPLSSTDADLDVLDAILTSS